MPLIKVKRLALLGDHPGRAGEEMLVNIDDIVLAIPASDPAVSDEPAIALTLRNGQWLACKGSIGQLAAVAEAIEIRRDR